jgi:hypothetical protein
MLWSFWTKGLAKETNLMQVLVVAWIETHYGINNVDIALYNYKIWNWIPHAPGLLVDMWKT